MNADKQDGIFISEYHRSVTSWECVTIVWYPIWMYLHDTPITRRMLGSRRCRKRRCPWLCQPRDQIPWGRCQSRWRRARGSCSRRRGRSPRPRRCWSSCLCRCSRATATGSRCRWTQSLGSSRSWRRRAIRSRLDAVASSWRGRSEIGWASATCSSAVPHRCLSPYRHLSPHRLMRSLHRRDDSEHLRERRRNTNCSSSISHAGFRLIEQTKFIYIKANRKNIEKIQWKGSRISGTFIISFCGLSSRAYLECTLLLFPLI